VIGLGSTLLLSSRKEQYADIASLEARMDVTQSPSSRSGDTRRESAPDSEGASYFERDFETDVLYADGSITGSTNLYYQQQQSRAELGNESRSAWVPNFAQPQSAVDAQSALPELRKNVDMPEPAAATATPFYRVEAQDFAESVELSVPQAEAEVEELSIGQLNEQAARTAGADRYADQPMPQGSTRDEFEVDRFKSMANDGPTEPQPSPKVSSRMAVGGGMGSGMPPTSGDTAGDDGLHWNGPVPPPAKPSANGFAFSAPREWESLSRRRLGRIAGASGGDPDAIVADREATTWSAPAPTSRFGNARAAQPYQPNQPQGGAGRLGVTDLDSVSALQEEEMAQSEFLGEERTLLERNLKLDFGTSLELESLEGQAESLFTPAKPALKAEQEVAKDTFHKELAEPASKPQSDNDVQWELRQQGVKRQALIETAAAEEPFSTFSLHVSDVSFKLAQAALAGGNYPEPDKVRIEEFVNAFDYGDPLPSQSEAVACRVEQCVHPFMQQRNLLRVSMRTAAAGRSSSTPLRLTFLLDNSGSMERFDRQQTVRRAFAMLAAQLRPDDVVSLISFARTTRLLADRVNGTSAAELVQLVDNLPSEGGTNIEAGLQLAFEKAREQRLDGAQNRIVLLTDGAVNLGDANPESLAQMIVTMRDAGIAFDAAGIGADGLNDEVLEALARKGDGRYYLLDSEAAADDGFAKQIAGALRPAAKNVKVQVEFNPNRVRRYKLLGFEKHLLNQEDFRNDAIDAAEMAAAEAGVAVYQFEAMPDGAGDVGSVSVRFRDLSTGQMVENRWPIPYRSDAPRIEEASPSMQVAATAALFAAKLKGDPLGESVRLKTLAEVIAGISPSGDEPQTRISQLQQMIQQARQIGGE
jgi:Mg-chelatase subunit ChlD